LREIINILLGNPDSRFAVYGSLRLQRDEGEEDNHGLIADLGNLPASAEGRKEYPDYAHPYPVFRWVLGAGTTPKWKSMSLHV
jgi:hypothetical protein